MKPHYHIVILFAALIPCACSRNADLVEEDAQQLTIRAYQEGYDSPTKTTVLDGGTQVFWEPTDEIKVFFGGSSGRFVSQNTENVPVTDFSGAIDIAAGAYDSNNSSNTLWGLYPYRSDATFDGVSVTTVLPSEQTGRAGSFAQNTHISLSQSSGLDMAFYNVCGGVRFSLIQDGIKSVTFEGNDGEPLAGKIKIVFANGVPVIQEVTDPQSVITLTAPEGGTFQAGLWYYISAIPGALSNGFTMKFFRDNESTQLSSSEAVTIKRGIFGSLADADPSLSGVKPVYAMPSDFLDDFGWDEGVLCYSDSKDDFYVVMHEETDEDDHNMVTVCINGLEKDTLEGAMLMHFCDGDLQDIYLSGLLFVVESCTETGTMTFVGYNEDGEYVGEFDVPYETMYRAETTGPLSKSPFFNSKGKFSWPKTQAFMEKAKPILTRVGIGLSAAFNLQEGKIGDIALDLLSGVAVGTVAGTSWPMWLTLIAEEWSKSLVKEIYDCIVSFYLGYAQIEIDSIQRTSKTTITVNGTISAVLSIPNYVGEEENTVYWGIAEDNYGQPGFNVNDNCSDLEPINGNTFSYTFYEETNPGQVHYFRPFLIPKAKTPSEANIASRIVSCIRYGERKQFLDMYVDLNNFEQIDCEPVNNNSYKAHFTIDGSIPGTFSDLANWGIDVATKSGSFSHRFSAKDSGAYYPPLETQLTCEISFNQADIVDYGIAKTVEITITPWISFWNSTPPFMWYDPQGYILTIEDGDHPKAVDLGLSVKWASCNVGATKPEEYGDYYAWGETRTKTIYSWDSYKWWDKEDEKLTKYCFSDNKFTITPQDDVANVNWGGAWRMPTDDEWTELRNNCTWTWVEDYKGTGTAGGIVTSNKVGYAHNSIFLPAAGHRVEGGLYDVGGHGRYWSSTLQTTDMKYAFFCSFDSEGIYRGKSHRCFAFSVRPVCE